MKTSFQFAAKTNLCVRNCFLVRNGFSALSFIESKHSAFSMTCTCRCFPLPQPLSLFCTMTALLSSTVIASHSPRRLLLEYQPLTDFLLPWHFLHLRATQRAPPADTVSFNGRRSSQSAHLRKLWCDVCRKELFVWCALTLGLREENGTFHKGKFKWVAQQDPSQAVRSHSAQLHPSQHHSLVALFFLQTHSLALNPFQTYQLWPFTGIEITLSLRTGT